MKDHTKNHGNKLREELSQKFGNLLELRDQLIDSSNPEGQIQAAKQLGQQQVEAETYLNLSPIIQDSIGKIIEGTTQYNVDSANFLKSAGVNGNKINQALSQTDLASVDFVNQKEVQGINYINELEYKQQVQEATLIQMNTQHQLKSAFHAVDALSRLQQMRLQPTLKQRDVDIQHQQARILENAKYGNKANEELLVKKNYLDASPNSSPMLPSVISNLASKLGLFI
jgi:hypothetical protein